MPSTRLVIVAAAIAPDDFNICDIARSLGAEPQSPKSKSPGKQKQSGEVFDLLSSWRAAPPASPRNLPPARKHEETLEHLGEELDRCANLFLRAMDYDFTILGSWCIQWCMSKVLTVRVEPGLLAKAEERAAQLGLDRARYVRNLIQQDLASATRGRRRRFASEDLVGRFRLGGEPATNRRVREMLSQRPRSKGEANR